MATIQVTCVTLNPPNSNSVEHITHIGYGNPLIKITVAEAIKRIKNKQDSFTVTDVKTKKTAIVEVVEPLKKTPYIRTHADNTTSDNLLSLPRCN